MRIRHLSNPRLGLLLVALALGAAPGFAAHNAAVEERMRRDVTYLASAECQGRGVLTQGINRAADYIAGEFQKAGLKPAGPNGSYFQPFTMTGEAKVTGPNAVALTGPLGQEWTLTEGMKGQFVPIGLSTRGEVTAPVVFAGYGATAKDLGYDDFKGIDVAGKVVILLRKTPRPDSPHAPFDGRMSTYHAGLINKVANAEAHKAAAMLFVNDRETARRGDDLMEFRYLARRGSGSSSIPAFHVRREVVDRMLRGSLGVGLDETEEAIDRDLKPRSAALKGWTARLQSGVERPPIHVKNVVGVLEGSGPLAHETVVLGAHYDHLGLGQEGGSMVFNLKDPTIHHGADDNASGTTTLIELARRFGALKDRAGRRLVFIAFSGEESGLLGSIHYCKYPLFPLQDTVAMLNMDMVGRMQTDEETKKGRLWLLGGNTAKGWDRLVQELNRKPGFLLNPTKGPGAGMGPRAFSASDNFSFYQKDIPVLFWFTGDHKDYHKPTDTADKINLADMARVADMVEDAAGYLATVKERPAFTKMQGGSPGPVSGAGGPGGGGAVLRIRPNYEEGKEGIILEGVTEGGPADKAGLRQGDRILELAGKPVRNIEVYMTVLQGLKKGEPIDVVIDRSGKKVTIKVTPE